MIARATHQKGRDCATSAFRNLLDLAGLPLSEASVFGLGKGLSFWYCDIVDSFPVLLGQNSYLEYNLCERLGAELLLHEPQIELEAAVAIKQVREGKPTVVKADCFYLDYCWRDEPDKPREHFGEHVLLITAIEGNDAVISDIFSDVLEHVPLDVLAHARGSTEGYEILLPRNRWYELRVPGKWGDPRELTKAAILESCAEMLHSEGKFGVRGMRRAALDLPTWVRGRGAESRQSTAFALEIMARRMDEGALGNFFRGFFFEFLAENAKALQDTDLASVVETYEAPVLSQWRRVISDLRRTSRDPDVVNSAALASTSAGLIAVAQLEEEMCQSLIKICQVESGS